LSVKKKKHKEAPSLSKAANEGKTQSNPPKNKEGITRAGEKRSLPIEEDGHVGEVGKMSAEAAVSGTSSRGHRKKRRRKGGDTSKAEPAFDGSEED